MPKKLGAMFITCALGPVNYAGSCIQQSRVLEGLRQLTPDSLSGGLQLGLIEIAKQVGMKPGDIASILPWDRINACLGRVDASQKLAVDAWNFHAGHIGGLLQGVADLTVDGRAPDASLCLERLAKKVSRDKPFSEPLRALSVEVGAWQDLIEHCRTIVDDGRAFEEAYRRRKMRTYALALGVGLVASGLAVVFLRYHTARSHVEASLAASDPCAVLELSEGDVDKASSSQAAQVLEHKVACETARARAKAEAAARAEAEAKRAAEEAKRKEQERACSSLAAHVDAGKLEENDMSAAGASAPLLERIARGEIDLSDLGPNEPALPCTGLPAGEKIRAAFAAAIVKSKIWPKVDDPSKATREALEKNKDSLPVWPVKLLVNRVESSAKKAIVAGEPSLVARTQKLCDLELAITGGNGPSCRSLLAIGKAP